MLPMSGPQRGARPETKWGVSTLFERRLEINGAVLDYSTDDFAAIQAAINDCTPAAAEGFEVCRMPPGVAGAMLSGELVFDRKKIQLDLNGKRWDWRPMTGSNKNCISPFCSSQADGQGIGDRAAMGGIVNGFVMRTLAGGNSAAADSLANNIVLINLDSAAEPGAGRMLYRDLQFEGATAFNCQRNAYITTFDHLTFSRCGLAIKSINRTLGNHSNQGERMAMSWCVFGNNFEHMRIEGEFWHLSNCSLDHLSNGGDLQRIATIDQGAVLLLNQCHVEFRDTDGLDKTGAATTAKRSMIYLGANSVLDWQSGSWYMANQKFDGTAVGNGADGYPTYDNIEHFVEFTANALRCVINPAYRIRTSLFKSRALCRMGDGVTVAPYVIAAGGSDEPNGGKSIAPLLGRAAQLNAAGSAVLGAARRFGYLREPNFGDTALPLADEWWLSGASGGLLAGQTTRYAATNVAISVSGNTLRVAKSAGPASALRLNLAVPIPKNSAVGFEITLAKTGGAAGNTVQIQLHKAMPGPQAATYLPDYQSTGQIGSTQTVLTFAGAGSEGPVTINANGFAATLDTGERVMTNESGTHLWVLIDLGTVDASTTPFELQVTSATVGSL